FHTNYLNTHLRLRLVTLIMMASMILLLADLLAAARVYFFNNQRGSLSRKACFSQTIRKIGKPSILLCSMRMMIRISTCTLLAGATRQHRVHLRTRTDYSS